jgi:hypothetical protein
VNSHKNILKFHSIAQGYKLVYTNPL